MASAELLKALAARKEEVTASDPERTIGQAGLAALALQAAERLSQDAPRDQCLCLPLGNDIASLVAALAVLDGGQPVALIPADAEPALAAPPFCAALATPEWRGGDLHMRLSEIPGRKPQSVKEGHFYVSTSGSTGKPKWIMHEGRRIFENAALCAGRVGLGPGDRVMIPVPIHHMFGLGAALLPSLIAGASVHLVPRGNPLEIFAAERAFDPDKAYFVPSQIRSLLSMRRRPRQYRNVFSACDKLLPDEAARFEALHGRVVGLYGTSELGVLAGATPEDDVSIRHNSSGRLLPGVALCGAAAAPEAPLADGVELYLSQPTRFLGYADDSGHVSEPAPECMNMGDWARFDADGNIRILGRADHAVKRDGLLVHLSEVEACLAAFPGIDDAAVVVAGQSRRGAGLTAFCAAERGAAPDPEELRRHCLSVLPARAVPDRFLLLDSLPLLASGKCDRQALARRASEAGQP